MKLVALKRLRYPRGVGGKEYTEGQEFNTLSEHDARALVLVRAAKVATAPAPTPVAPAPVPASAATATAHPLDHDEDGRKGGSRSAPRRYNRRDVEPED